jgi:hypothetical protein
MYSGSSQIWFFASGNENFGVTPVQKRVCIGIKLGTQLKYKLTPAVQKDFFVLQVIKLQGSMLPASVSPVSN